MINYQDFEDDFNDFPEESYPDFFYEWDEVLSENKTPFFTDADELSEIIEIYLAEGEVEKAKQTIQLALSWHPDNEDLIYDVLLLLNDFELWNDLLALSEQYHDMPEVWADGHKLTALLHLGMEEDAFLFFQKMKRKYEEDKDNLSVIYQAMSEALQEVDLFEASAIVTFEAIDVLGAGVDLFWLLLQAFVEMRETDKALEIAAKIEQIDPLEGETWYRLGSIYLDLEAAEKAIDAFEFAESLGYQKQSNYLGLVTAYEKNGNPLKALEKTKECLQHYPENYMTHILAANICADMSLWADALGYIDEALKIIPDLDSLYLYKSKFYINLGEQKKAIAVLKEGMRQTDDKEGDLQKELEKLQQQNNI